MGVNLLVGLVERDLAVDRLPGLLVGLVHDVEKLAQGKLLFKLQLLTTSDNNLFLVTRQNHTIVKMVVIGRSNSCRDNIWDTAVICCHVKKMIELFLEKSHLIWINRSAKKVCTFFATKVRTYIDINISFVMRPIDGAAFRSDILLFKDGATRRASSIVIKSQLG